MMYRLTLAAAGTALLLAVLTPASVAFEALPVEGPQQEVAATLINPGHQDRLGLPDFVVTGADPELAAAAKTVADVLWDDLDFEQEYYMIPRRTSAAIPAAPATALPYDRWVQLGADFVAAASASRAGDTLQIELRIMDARAATRGKQVFGAAYRCRVQAARFCAHSIANEVHKTTKALDGVALTKLAFNSDRDATRVAGRPSQTGAVGKEIYVSDYDGGAQQRFTVNRNLNISPVWSPGGGQLAYTSYLPGFPDIFVANLRTPGALRQPAQAPAGGSNYMASWSPDGSKLAVVSNRSGNLDIWVVNADGSGLLNLTAASRAMEGAPTWSPDGGRIAFTSDRESGAGTPFLYVMNASGGAVQTLTRQYADRPTWSSQNVIAFTTGSQNHFDIGAIDMGDPNRTVRILTDGLGSNEGPTVAPNGRHVAFVTTRWGKKQIAIIPITGDSKRLKQITTAGNNDFPNWQPFAAGQQ